MSLKFYNMPAGLLENHKARIKATSGKEEAEDALRSLGYGWGKIAVEGYEMCSDLESLNDNIQTFFIEMGLNKVDVEIEDDYINVNVREGEVEDNDFMAGYITGAVSALLKKDYVSEKIEDEERLSLVLKQKKDIGEFELEFMPKSGGQKTEFNLDPGSYMIEDNIKSEKTVDIIQGAIDNDVPCLCATRQLPPKFKKIVEGAKSYFWLSDSQTTSGSAEYGTLNPTRIDYEIIKEINIFYKENPGGMIMFEGLDYLVTQNNDDFNKILKFVQKVKDLTERTDSYIIFPVDPATFESKEYAKLTRSLEEISDI